MSAFCEDWTTWENFVSADAIPWKKGCGHKLVWHIDGTCHEFSHDGHACSCKRPPTATGKNPLPPAIYTELLAVVAEVAAPENRPHKSGDHGHTDEVISKLNAGRPKYDETRVTRMRASLQDSSTADLVDAAAMARYELETAKRIDALFSDALYQRRGEATVLDGTDSVAEMSQGQSPYEWNATGLLWFLDREKGINASQEGLVEYIQPPPFYKVDTRKALKFAKDRAIDLTPFYKTEKTAPRWEYSDKAKKEDAS